MGRVVSLNPNPEICRILPFPASLVVVVGGSQTGSELTLINVGGRISEKILENAESRIRDKRMLPGKGAIQVLN